MTISQSHNYINKFLRRLKHLQKSGCLITGIEHFLVMFPSALLIANLAYTEAEIPVISLSTILLFSGIGTLIFILLTDCKIPVFLGPSFSYIGFTSYYVASVSNTTQIEDVRSIILWGYILAGVFLFFMSLLYRFEKIQNLIKFLFPDVVMGPAISMIGLELADLAVRDSGFQENDDNAKFLAIFTLIVIILSSLIRFKFLKNSSVLVGIIAGCVLSSILSITNIDMFLKPISLLKVPEINLDFLVHRPQNLFTLFIAVIPATMVSFTENLGRIAVLEGMIKRDNVQKDFLGTKLTYNSLKGHALSDLVSVICGAVPNQIYAENLAIMNLNNSNKSNKNRIKSDDDLFVNECYSPYTVIPYAIGAILSIVVACFGGLQNLFIAIPKPVFGGMEFFIFGLITAPGIQLLVEQKVNYKKISNQIITASVLLAGVSSLSLDLKIIELKGMSLGLLIGVVLNLLTKLLEYLGLLNERIGMLEIIEICLENFSNRVSLSLTGNHLYSKKKIPYNVSELKKIIQEKDLYPLIISADTIELFGEESKKSIYINQNYDKIIIETPIRQSQIAALCNDYEYVIAMAKPNYVQIIVTASTSAKQLKTILRQSISEL